MRNGQTQSQQIEVLVDGTQDIGLITPVGTSYSLYETSNFTVTAGTHTIQFIGMNPQGGNNTALIDVVALTTAHDEISDGGFETPVLTANTYQVAPTATPWQFSGLAGITANNSGLTSGTANAPQGAQVGFIMNNGSIEPYPLPGCRNVQPLVPGRPTRHGSDREPANRGLLDGRRSSV